MEENDDTTIVPALFNPQAVIVAAGDFPTDEVPLGFLHCGAFLASCDGAAAALIEHGIVPDAIIGDCDSLPPDIASQYAAIIHHVPDQETNDLTKAVRFLADMGFHNIIIVGATGKREDHTLGNISLLIEYMEMGLRVRMVTDHGIFIPVAGNSTFRSFLGQQVSIFSLGASHLHSSGLKYPLYDFSCWWQGTLNEATASSFSIRAHGEYILYIVSKAVK